MNWGRRRMRRYAQQWHDEQADIDGGDHEYWNCWCCCIACNPGWSDHPNPYWDRAHDELSR